MGEYGRTSKSQKKVCIIGAGISGLATARVLRDDGFDVEVFEKQPEPGGVWATSRTYPGLRANNSKESYAFSDFPYPATTDDFPTAGQIRAYLGAYADHFGLRPLLRLSTEVHRVSKIPAHGSSEEVFSVTVSPTGSVDQAETREFDYCVVCNGVFSEPFKPELEGRALFVGQALHSSELTDPLSVRGKRVIVVGAGKSALDCAGWIARHARKCTLVFRSPHWMAPRYFMGRIRTDWIVTTRFFELFLRYHHLTLIESFLHGPGGGLVRAWWRAWSRLIRRSLRIPSSLVPDAPLPAGFENIGIGGEFYRALGLGTLDVRRARVTRFAGREAVELDTGEMIGADMVVLATGWRQGLPFLDTPLSNRVVRNGRLRLYRHIIPPGEPQLGFIGYASSTACQLTSEVAAHWLSECFRGDLHLPGFQAMEREIERVLRWSDEVFPGRNQGYFVGPFVTHYLDDLIRDMGLPHHRAGNPLAEYFSPSWPVRYQGLGEERRRRRLVTA